MNLEERYIVIKHADLCRSGINDADLATLMRILSMVDDSRNKRGKQPITSLVIEHDWPEYTPTLKMLSTRVDSETKRSISNTNTFSVPYGESKFNHSAADISQVIDLFDTSKDYGLQVEVMMTYSNSLRQGSTSDWTYTQHMLYALGEWDI